MLDRQVLIQKAYFYRTLFYDKKLWLSDRRRLGKYLITRIVPEKKQEWIDIWNESNDANAFNMFCQRVHQLTLEKNKDNTNMQKDQDIVNQLKLRLESWSCPWASMAFFLGIKTEYFIDMLEMRVDIDLNVIEEANEIIDKWL